MFHKDNVAMRLRCGGNFNSILLQIYAGKRFWKSVNIWQSYGQE